MGNDVKNLQDIINSRAEKRLEGDIKAIWEMVYSNPLLQRNDADMPQLFIQAQSNGQIIYKGSAPKWVFEPKSEFMKKLYEYYLPQYLKEESERFVQQVDELMVFKSEKQYDY